MSTLTLPGYRIHLRPIRLDDVDHIMPWINDPAVTRNFAGMSQRITRDQELCFLEGILASDNDRMFAIESAHGDYLGNAGLHKIYWPAKNARIGLMLGPAEARGRGLGTEALRLIIGEAFQSLGLHKVWIMHFASNARMHHMVKKHGFIEEGVLRDEYYHREGWHDMLRHSLLAHEFEERAQGWGLSG